MCLEFDLSDHDLSGARTSRSGGCDVIAPLCQVAALWWALSRVSFPAQYWAGRFEGSGRVVGASGPRRGSALRPSFATPEIKQADRAKPGAHLSRSTTARPSATLALVHRRVDASTKPSAIHAQAQVWAGSSYPDRAILGAGLRGLAFAMRWRRDCRSTTARPSATLALVHRRVDAVRAVARGTQRRRPRDAEATAFGVRGSSLSGRWRFGGS